MDWSAVLTEENSTPVYGHTPRPSRIKRIFTQLINRTVALGDLLFRVNIKNPIKYDSDNANLTLITYDDQDYRLRIKLSTEQIYDVPVTIVDETKINKLMQGFCSWIIKDISEYLIKIQIVIKLEQLPIYKSSFLAEYFFKEDYSKFEKLATDKKQHCDEFFLDLKKYQVKYEEKEVNFDKLIPTLRPYQCRAVQWMLTRERDEIKFEGDWIWDVVRKKETICGKILYYYVYSKVLSEEIFDFLKYFKGGILADEMGLGKTVVVITTILNNPRDISRELDNDGFLKAEVDFEPAKKKFKIDDEPKILRCLCGHNDSSLEPDLIQCKGCWHFQHGHCVNYDENYVYFCPPCWMKQKLVKSKATLVVAPTSIFKQWFDEISKHVDEEAWGKGVFMYDGVKKHFIQPSVLASYDIVITTYQVLATEFGYTSETKINFRHERKYIRECSPISQIQWWRVVLDEAQMVEYGHNSIIVSQMAKLIPAVNHWAVTGTPIQRSANDLFYLIDWFGVKPFNDRNFWDSCLYWPYVNGEKNPLFSVLSQIFWRNSKEDVAGELTIPNQLTVYHPVKFTAIEQSFYMREHAEISEKFTEEINRLGLNLDAKLDLISRYKLTQVLKPMLKLRQACSHHLAVHYEDISDMFKERKECKNGKVKETRDLSKSMTLEALCTYMTRKTHGECYNAFKLYLSTLNDLAGLYCDLMDYPSAVGCYRKMVDIVTEYEDKINVKFFRMNLLKSPLESLATVDGVLDEMRAIAAEFGQFFDEGWDQAWNVESYQKIIEKVSDFIVDSDHPDKDGIVGKCIKISNDLVLTSGRFEKIAILFKTGMKKAVELEPREDEVVDGDPKNFWADQSDKHLSDLKKKYGTLVYLRNLEKKSREPCPVCFSELTTTWCLFQCGHSYCTGCTKSLLTLNDNQFVFCGICREQTSRPDIGLVDLNTNVEVKGNHSSKIDAVLTTLLELLATDPGVKVLIFSKWDVVLSVLAKAFRKNDILFKRLPSSQVEKTLDDFKDPFKMITALLLPYTWGCKGLNLIEATHVFLVEPTLNPTEELQAVGRVHRMGQTEETVVHRFLVKGTIEEAIHSAVSEAKDKWDREIATLEDLKNLFVVK